jgi:CspA family cold shock protein
MSEKETGVVKWFDEKKGYGFIARQSGEDVFVHYSDITGQSGFRTLKEGDNVEFSIKKNPKGQAAADVTKI